MIFLSKYQKVLERKKLSHKKFWYEKMSVCIGESHRFICGENHRIYLKRFDSIQGIIHHLKKALSFDYQQMKVEISRID